MWHFFAIMHVIVIWQLPMWMSYSYGKNIINPYMPQTCRIWHSDSEWECHMKHIMDFLYLCAIYCSLVGSDSIARTPSNTNWYEYGWYDMWAPSYSIARVKTAQPTPINLTTGARAIPEYSLITLHDPHILTSYILTTCTLMAYCTLTSFILLL